MDSCVLVSPMKILVLSNSSGPLGPHASCVHEVALVHARCVRSQGSSPRSGATATNFHSQWRAAGSWKLGGCIPAFTTKTPRHKDSCDTALLAQPLLEGLEHATSSINRGAR